jgi:hypothetical protein
VSTDLWRLTSIILKIEAPFPAADVRKPARSEWPDNVLASKPARLQWLIWDELKYEDWKSPEPNRAAGKLAEELKRMLI